MVHIQLIAPLLIIHREAQGKGWISSASTVASETVSGDRDIRIGRFSDIQFVSDTPYSRTTGTQISELTSKRDSSGQVAMALSVEEVNRGGHDHEAIELREV